MKISSTIVLWCSHLLNISLPKLKSLNISMLTYSLTYILSLSVFLGIFSPSHVWTSYRYDGSSNSMRKFARNVTTMTTTAEWDFRAFRVHARQIHLRSWEASHHDLRFNIATQIHILAFRIPSSRSNGIWWVDGDLFPVGFRSAAVIDVFNYYSLSRSRLFESVVNAQRARLKPTHVELEMSFHFSFIVMCM